MLTTSRKIGIIFALLGLFIPSILYPFTEPTQEALKKQLMAISRGASIDLRLNDLEIVLKREDLRYNDPSKRMPFAIPYKYFVAVGITLIFIGFSFIFLTNPKRGYDG